MRFWAKNFILAFQYSNSFILQPYGLQRKSAILTGQKYGSYRSKVWHLRVVTLRVVGAKCGSGNCWLGIYTLYHIYVGDKNSPRKIRHIKSTAWNPMRGRDAPRHVSTLGCIVGLCWRRATARLYVGYETIGIYCCLLSVVLPQKKYPLKINDIPVAFQHPPFCVATPGCWCG